MNILKASLVAAGLTMAAGAASAATLTYEGEGARANVTAKDNTPNAGPDYPDYINRAAASFKMKDATNALGLGTDFFAYCLDLAGTIANSENYVINNLNPFQPVRVLQPIQRANVELLFDAAYASVDSTNSTDAAAFQLALWEAGYETAAGPLSLTSGNRIGSGSTAAITARANEFLGWMTGTVSDLFTVNFLDADRDNSQDLVMAVRNVSGGPSPVPVPGAAVLLLGGLGALGALRKRSKAKA
jgi:hypothetical protein